MDDFALETVREHSRGASSSPFASSHPRNRVDAESHDEFVEAFLEITGMHCTTCEAFINLRGNSLEGIESVEANYATDIARVRYDPERIDLATLPEALSGYGYAASFRDDASDYRQTRAEETFQRLVVGGILAMMIMPWYVFFLYPSYAGIETGILTVDMTTPFGLYFPMGVIAIFSAGVVFYTGWPILRGAYVSLRMGQPNMDLLLSVAILSAFTFSTVALAKGSTHLYYDVAVAIVLVVTAGGYYEGRLKREATNLLSELTSTRVNEATRQQGDGTTATVSVDDLAPGDEVIVRPGERVPVDGVILSGVAAVDEAVLTGESLPDTKGPGDEVVGGSLVTDSSLILEVGDNAESTLDRLSSLVWAVQSERPGVQRFVDRLAVVFVPAVLFLGGGVAVWRFITAGSVSGALLAGLTVLVVACPCAMGLATPLAISSGLRDALRKGIVVTNSSLFETILDVDTIVFDKTGTLTTGDMTVRSVVGDDDALASAAAVEEHSSHPVAAAVIEHVRAATDDTWGITDDEARKHQETIPIATDFERHPGEGVSGHVNGERVVVGTPHFVERTTGPLPAELLSSVEDAQVNSDLPVVVGCGDAAVAVAIVGDQARHDWSDVLDAFSDKRIVILTGDNESAVAPFRDHPAVDEVFAGVPSEGKMATVRQFQSVGTVAMVGDGTNDAPALGAADVGIALGGTANAADAADVAIVSGSLTDVPTIFDLAASTRRRIRENVGWAFGYNGIAIPLAVTGLLNPLFAALAMTASSILVVTNSRRKLL